MFYNVFRLDVNRVVFGFRKCKINEIILIFLQQKRVQIL